MVGASLVMGEGRIYKVYISRQPPHQQEIQTHTPSPPPPCHSRTPSASPTQPNTRATLIAPTLNPPVIEMETVPRGCSVTQRGCSARPLLDDSGKVSMWAAPGAACVGGTHGCVAWTAPPTHAAPAPDIPPPHIPNRRPVHVCMGGDQSNPSGTRLGHEFPTCDYPNLSVHGCAGVTQALSRVFQGPARWTSSTTATATAAARSATATAATGAPLPAGVNVFHGEAPTKVAVAEGKAGWMATKEGPASCSYGLWGATTAPAYPAPP